MTSVTIASRRQTSLQSTPRKPPAYAKPWHKYTQEMNECVRGTNCANDQRGVSRSDDLDRGEVTPTSSRSVLQALPSQRNHQGLDNKIIEPDFGSDREGEVNCHDRLGGLLRYYYRDAA